MSYEQFNYGNPGVYLEEMGDSYTEPLIQYSSIHKENPALVREDQIISSLSELTETSLPNILTKLLLSFNNLIVFSKGMK